MNGPAGARASSFLRSKSVQLRTTSTYGRMALTKQSPCKLRVTISDGVRAAVLILLMQPSCSWRLRLCPLGHRELSPFSGETYTP
jgi:hypothetical protein